MTALGLYHYYIENDSHYQYFFEDPSKYLSNMNVKKALIQSFLRYNLQQFNGFV